LKGGFSLFFYTCKEHSLRAVVRAADNKVCDFPFRDRANNALSANGLGRIVGSRTDRSFFGDAPRNRVC